jgi:hypothetical protein
MRRKNKKKQSRKCQTEKYLTHFPEGDINFGNDHIHVFFSSVGGLKDYGFLKGISGTTATEESSESKVKISSEVERQKK